MTTKMGTIHLAMTAALMATALTMAGAQTSAPVKDDLFAGTEIFAKGASDVTEITMDPDTLGMVGGKEKARARGMVLNVVHTYEYDKPGMYRIEDVEAFRNKLNTGDWHCSVHTRSLKTGESTDMCTRQRTDGLAESAIITVEPKQLTFIHTIRKKGEGESELGDLPWMSLHGLPALAMLDPQMFVDMQRAQGRMPVDMAAIQAQVDKAMSAMPRLDSAEMQKKMDEAMKSLHQAQKQFGNPDGKQPE